MDSWKYKEWQEFYCDKLFIRSSLQMHYCKEIDGKLKLFSTILQNGCEKIIFFRSVLTYI